jgi:hypothetical protein
MVPYRLLLLLGGDEGWMAAEIIGTPKYPGSGTFTYAGMTGTFTGRQ